MFIWIKHTHGAVRGFGAEYFQLRQHEQHPPSPVLGREGIHHPQRHGLVALVLLFVAWVKVSRRATVQISWRPMFKNLFIFRLRMLEAFLAAGMLSVFPAVTDDSCPQPNFLVFISDDKSVLERGIHGWSGLEMPAFKRAAKLGCRVGWTGKSVAPYQLMSEPPKPDRYQVKNIAGRMDNDILLTG